MAEATYAQVHVHEDLTDVVASLGAVLRLAQVRKIEPRDAAMLVFAELGWGGSSAPPGWAESVMPKDALGTERAYYMARAFIDAAEALGAPMTNERLYESAA